jgi:hypothetical protein
VQRFGGFVAKYMGDGVLVYFGYPQAHEDDAERAVRAGLDLVAAVENLKTHPPLQTRVCIATGLVVVGDLIGSGASQEQAIVGETPNLAARLQSLAEPNEVVIADDTRKLIGHLFELEDLGATDLKGIPGPVSCSVVLRPASVESRFDAFHTGGLTELVGREEEVELILRRWSKAKSGEGQVVLISGEAGIGKSRLTAALMERLAAEPHTRLRNFCSPQHTDSTLYPIIGSWNAPPVWRVTIPRGPSSTSSMPFSRKAPPQPRMRHSLPRCSRCRTMAAIPCSICLRRSAGKKRWKHWFHRWRLLRAKIRC